MDKLHGPLLFALPAALKWAQALGRGPMAAGVGNLVRMLLNEAGMAIVLVLVRIEGSKSLNPKP